MAIDTNQHPQGINAAFFVMSIQLQSSQEWCEKTKSTISTQLQLETPAADDPEKQEQIVKIYQVYKATLQLAFENLEEQQKAGAAILEGIKAYLSQDKTLGDLQKVLTDSNQNSLLETWKNLEAKIIDQQQAISQLSHNFVPLTLAAASA